MASARSRIATALVSLALLACTKRPVPESARDGAAAGAGGSGSPSMDAAPVDAAADVTGPTPDAAGPAPDAVGPCTVTTADGSTVACTEMLVGSQLSDTYCGLKPGGQLRCWSYHEFFDAQLEPLVAKAPPGLVRIAVSDVTSSEPFLCGIDGQGAGTCWGASTRMSLGTGVVSAVLTRYGTCALYQDGRVTCASDFPPLPSDRRYVQVAVGADFNMGLDDTGTPIHFQPDVRAPPGVYRRIAMFSSLGAALRDDGALVILHPQGPRVFPGAFVDLAFAYRENICGLEAAGEIRCFVMTDAQPSPPPPPPGPFIQIAASARSVCGLRLTGTTTCWGDAPVRVPDGW